MKLLWAGLIQCLLFSFILEIRSAAAWEFDTAGEGYVKLTDSEVCPEDIRPRLWAQERVNADLLEEQYSHFLKLGSAPPTRVAVVDTGFDWRGNGKNVTQISLKKGHDQAGPPEEDTGGHGTFVASLISGKNSIGISPDAELTVYRVTGAEEGTGVQADRLFQSVDRACEDGNEVINLSWGGEADETGEYADEVAWSDLIAKMARKGCLVIKAAGNSARDRDETFNDPDDAYLRTAASSPSGRLTYFSTQGEILAPGQNVFVFESSWVPVDVRLQKGRRCGKLPGGFVNGTSFSAPITAAVAARVLRILKTRDDFSHLSGPERIALLNRILIGSQRFEGLDALRAARAAYLWTQSSDYQIRRLPLAKEVASLLDQNSPSFCRSGVDSCESLTAASEIRGCYHDIRVRLSLCNLPRATWAQSLSLTAYQNRNLGDAVYWARVAQQLGAISPPLNADRVLTDYLELRRVRRQRPQVDRLDFDFLMELVPAILAESLPNESRRVAEVITLLLSQTRGRFANIQGERQFREDWQNLTRLLLQYSEKFGDEALLHLTRRILDQVSTSQSLESGALFAMRLANEFISQAAGSSLAHFKQSAQLIDDLTFDRFGSGRELNQPLYINWLEAEFDDYFSSRKLAILDRFSSGAGKIRGVSLIYLLKHESAIYSDRWISDRKERARLLREALLELGFAKGLYARELSESLLAAANSEIYSLKSVGNSEAPSIDKIKKEVQDFFATPQSWKVWSTVLGANFRLTFNRPVSQYPLVLDPDYLDQIAVVSSAKFIEGDIFRTEGGDSPSGIGELSSYIASVVPYLLSQMTTRSQSAIIFDAMVSMIFSKLTQVESHSTGEDYRWVPLQRVALAMIQSEDVRKEILSRAAGARALRELLDRAQRGPDTSFARQLIKIHL